MSATNIAGAFGWLVSRDYVHELNNRDTVRTVCLLCPQTWERHRRDGRRVTVADRSAAVEHLRDKHDVVCPEQEASHDVS